MRTIANHSPAVRFALAISRLLTWGLAESDRREMHLEMEADWEAMAAEGRPVAIVLRSLRGIPASLWARFDDHQTTVIPASFALAMLGLGGLAAAGLGTAYPVSLRVSIGVAGAGSLGLGLLLIRQPRQLETRRYRGTSLITAAGFIGMAHTIPSADAWVGNRPAREWELLDAMLASAFLVVGLGFAALALATAFAFTRRLVRHAGFAIIAGFIMFAVAQFTWAWSVASNDLAIAFSSMGAGLAGLMTAHVVPRLRHLEMM